MTQQPGVSIEQPEEPAKRLPIDAVSFGCPEYILKDPRARGCDRVLRIQRLIVSRPKFVSRHHLEVSVCQCGFRAAGLMPVAEANARNPGSFSTSTPAWIRAS